MVTRPTPQPGSAEAIVRDRYDAVLLNLDGVITDTPDLHAACWKQMFDNYLRKRAARKREPFHLFDIATDYHQYVDGKPRSPCHEKDGAPIVLQAQSHSNRRP